MAARRLQILFLCASVLLVALFNPASAQTVCKAVRNNKACAQAVGCIWFKKKCKATQCSMFTNAKTCNARKDHNLNPCVWKSNKCVVQPVTVSQLCLINVLNPPE